MRHARTEGWRERLLLRSASRHRAASSLEDVLSWLEKQRVEAGYRVSVAPLGELDGWHVDGSSGNLAHRSGRFFSIEGVDATERDATGEVVRRWRRPIINQPESGIVGFIVQNIEGTPHVLVQAKMEPGNCNLVQISPTVQATRSNYTGAHGGGRTPLVEYFLDSEKSEVLYHQLQSEQGSVFFRKRNRNMVVVVPDGEVIDTDERFRWVTVRQLTDLLRMDDVVNMDARSVLSCMSLAADPSLLPFSADQDTFEEAVYRSLTVTDAHASEEFESIVAWIAEQRSERFLDSRLVALGDVAGWEYDGSSIHATESGPFRVVGVDVVAQDREVGSWQQPLIDSSSSALCAFACCRLSGVLHIAVQALVEPGTFDVVEIAPTVQGVPAALLSGSPSGVDPLVERILDAPRSAMRFDTMQSEEGGRFYCDRNRYLVVEFDQAPALPKSHRWVTLSQLKRLLMCSNMVNIEARTLIAALTTAPAGES